MAGVGLVGGMGLGLVDYLVDDFAEAHAGLVDLAAAVDGDQESGDFVVVDDRTGLLFVLFKTVTDGGFVGIVTAVGDGGAFVDASDKLFARSIDGDDTIETALVTLEEEIERLRLLDGAREAIEDDALVGGGDGLVDQTDDDIVAHQIAPIHERFDTEAERGAVGHFLTEHFAGGEMVEIIFFGQQ